MSEFITLKGIIDEDFVNYRVPSMVLIFPFCSFKCGTKYCQNSSLAKDKDITVSIDDVCNRYIRNTITEAIVCQGLEPIDSWDELNYLISCLRKNKLCNDDIVIYTGYEKNEIIDKINYLKGAYTNIIIKYGRYMPNQNQHFDQILGVNLASNNQYAERIC